MNKFFLGAYIVFLVGLAATSVGDLPTTTEPYTWSLPALVFLLLAPAALFGYMAGKDSSVAAARDAYLRAASSLIVEPVAWRTDDHLDDTSATTYSREVADRWKAKGWPVTPLYRVLPPTV